MNPNPEEQDTLLMALDRLDEAERQDASDALAINATLAGELRHNEDALVLAWQAVSPLQRAPTSSLPKILTAIEDETVTRRQFATRKMEATASEKPNRRWSAALPWAAAFAFAMLYLTKNPSTPTSTDSAALPAPIPAEIPSEARRIRETHHSPDGSLATAARLRSRLEDADSSHSASLHPQIRALYAPGGNRSPATDPASTRLALLSLLTEALAADLERANEAPSDLVIETGWITELAGTVDPDAVVRHRDFPIDDAARLGLLASPDGTVWFDPANGMIWSPAEDGGGHIGRLAGVIDLSDFQSPAPPAIREAPAVPEKQRGDAPDGFLVSDPDSGTSTIVMNNLIGTDFRELTVIPAGSQGLSYPVANMHPGGTVLLDYPAIHQNQDFTVVATNATTGEQVTILTSSDPHESGESGR